VLRVFRDHILMPNAGGRALVRTYYRLSPPLARAIEGNESLKAITRVALRPAIIGAGFALASPLATFVVFAVVGSTLVALLVLLSLAHRGVVARRGAVVATFLVALGVVVIVGLLNFGPTGRPTAPLASHTAPQTALVQRQRGTEQAGVERYDVRVERHRDWPLAPGSVKVRPTFHSGQLGYEVRSDLADGILTADGFTVTEPKAAAAVGITSGDRIVTINGFPPAGGAFASFLLLQRDPDRNGVTIQLERGGIRMERALVVR
jgi:membrane-associated protease RseP (regulator of RpoE activity)